MRLLILAGLVATLSMPAAKANMKGDAHNCIHQPTPQIAVDACTRLLRAKKLPPRMRAIMRTNRGIAYDLLKKYPLALRDYDEAIRLDPTYHHAYYNRALVYVKIGNRPAAIADFSMAVKLSPAGSHTRTWARHRLKALGEQQ